MTQKALRALVRASYVKVAEYQCRGLVHLHMVIRLDRAHARLPRPGDQASALPLHRRAARGRHPGRRGGRGRAAPRRARRWTGALGGELEVRRLDDHERRKIAGYLAKYATKSTELAGGVVHPVSEHQVDALPVREHVRAYMREAFVLAADPALAEHRFGATAHALGYRGHCLTKSRRYSTTFKALRAARERHLHEQLLARSGDAAQRALAAATERVATFRYVGRGHITAAEALLAASAAVRAREQRRAAREALAVSGSSGRTTEGGDDGD